MNVEMHMKIGHRALVGTMVINHVGLVSIPTISFIRQHQRRGGLGSSPDGTRSWRGMGKTDGGTKAAGNVD